MALSAMASMRAAVAAPPTRSRADAARELYGWLEAGGPLPSAKGSGELAPPLLHRSSAFEIDGTEDCSNLTLRATRDVPKGHFIMAVAKSSVLHPRSEALSGAQRAVIECVAEKLGAAAQWETPLVNGKSPGRLELVALVALELLRGVRSAWHPYLQTLPSAQFASTPSLWPRLHRDSADAAIAVGVLRDTSIGHLIQADELDLQRLSEHPAGRDAARILVDAAGDGVTEAAAALAMVRAIGLVSTRLVSGVGMVPLFDLMNGASHSEHNATIESTNLAASADAPEQAPCVAALASRAIRKGEEVLLSYGRLSAAEFLYKYGWPASGGADVPNAATADEHDTVSLVPHSLWTSLRPAQLAVLDKYQISAARLGLSEQAPCASPFSVPRAEAAAGKTTPLMRQV